MNETIHELANGRKYRVIDTQKEYDNDEYSSSGLVIQLWEPRHDQWIFLANSPDQECVDNFLKAAERMEPLEQWYAKHDSMAKRIEDAKEQNPNWES